MYQRLDFNNWNIDQANNVRAWLSKINLLEDYEIIEGIDHRVSGFFEFNGIPSEEVEFLSEHYDTIIDVHYRPDEYTLGVSFIEFIPEEGGE